MSPWRPLKVSNLLVQFAGFGPESVDLAFMRKAPICRSPLAQA